MRTVLVGTGGTGPALVAEGDLSALRIWPKGATAAVEGEDAAVGEAGGRGQQESDGSGDLGRRAHGSE